MQALNSKWPLICGYIFSKIKFRASYFSLLSDSRLKLLEVRFKIGKGKTFHKLYEYYCKRNSTTQKQLSIFFKIKQSLSTWSVLYLKVLSFFENLFIVSHYSSIEPKSA